MDSTQDRLGQHAPEVVQQSYPEVVQYPFHNNYQAKPETGPAGTHTSSTTPHSNYANPATHNSPHAYHASAVDAQPPPPGGGAHHHGKKGKNGLLCGCTTLVFILSAIIAILAAAVVGLAVGTGVEANRADTAEAKVSSLRSSLATVTATTTVASASATSTSFAELDSNCSGDPSGVNGTTYTSFSLISDQAFTIRCNADALGPPLLSLFTSALTTCMDACAAYTSHALTSFGNTTNSTCGGVSFIPLWTNKTAALLGGAPGNCYLKPMQTDAPNTPDIGTECHAGVLSTS